MSRSPERVSTKIEQISKYRSKVITRILYFKQTPHEGEPAFERIVFGCQAPGGDVATLRPFFILEGEDPGVGPNFESAFFISEKDGPFALEIDTSFPGTGAFWNSYVFVFTPGEARISYKRRVADT